MTCIAGFLEDSGDIYMGGDSIGVCGSEYILVKDPKVFVKRNMIFGFTNSFRLGDILKYDFQIPDHPPELSTYEYLTSVFLVELIARYEERKCTTITENVMMADSFLLGYNKRLFRIENDLCVLEDVFNFNSLGGGQEFAKATMYNQMKEEMNPVERVLNALDVASVFSLVKPPYTVLMLPNDVGLNVGSNLDSK